LRNFFSLLLLLKEGIMMKNKKTRAARSK